MNNEQLSIIAPFENDLNSMTVEEMRTELERLETDDDWREALQVCLAIQTEATKT